MTLTRQESSGTLIFVPAEAVDAYKKAEGWSAYKDKITAFGA